MSDIEVVCDPRTGGWLCRVSVMDGGEATRYEVGVTAGDLERLAPGSADPADLVRASFEFLLEREPPGSILRSFDLPVIGRYFPGFEDTIGRRIIRRDV